MPSRTHGMTNTILYGKYSSMKARCYNPNYKYYDRYGGRGIKVCDEWKDSFEKFADWAYQSGYDETKIGYEQSLDRIDLDGDYEPLNCRWVTQKEQVSNRSNSVSFTYKCVKMNPYDFSKAYGISDKLFIYRRLKKGQPPEKILHDWNMLHNTPAEYMDMDEACEEYGVSSESIRAWLKQGIINGVKIGHKWFVLRGQPAKTYSNRDAKGRFVKGKNRDDT